MSAFDTALAHLFKWEGGFSDDIHDNGGVTKYGISIVFAGSIKLDLNGDGKTTRADIVALTRDYAAGIYREHFWDKCRCGLMPRGVALLTFDFAVNAGPGRSIRFLQATINDMGHNLKVDGAIGPKTLAALRSLDNEQASVIEFMTARRILFYSRLADWQHYQKGWTNRSLNTMTTALLG